MGEDQTDVSTSVGFDDVEMASALVAFDSDRDGDLDLVQISNDDVPCPTDFDDSGTVDITDLILVLSTWGPCERCPADLDDNGIVEFADLLQVLGASGPCP